MKRKLLFYCIKGHHIIDLESHRNKSLKTGIVSSELHSISSFHFYFAMSKSYRVQGVYLKYVTQDPSYELNESTNQPRHLLLYTQLNMIYFFEQLNTKF